MLGTVLKQKVWPTAQYGSDIAAWDHFESRPHIYISLTIYNLIKQVEPSTDFSHHPDKLWMNVLHFLNQA